MLALLFRRRRPAAHPPYVRRLALEYLEGRNAPSSLDPTSSLTSFDLATSPDQPASQPAPALTDTSSASGGTTSLGGSQPAPATGTFLAALVAPALPPATTGSGTAPGGGTVAGAADSTTPGDGGLLPPPVIDSCVAAENSDLTVTASGHVTDPNPATLTVTFSGWVMDGLHTSVDTGGNFSITFNVPHCTSAGTANHTCTAVAGDGAGRVSAPFTFMVEQTPS